MTPGLLSLQQKLFVGNATPMAHKADVTAICELIVWTIWDP
jgi:hypothetical protein